MLSSSEPADQLLVLRGDPLERVLITASCSSVHPELHNHALHFWLEINRITNRPKVGHLQEPNHCSIVLIAPQSVGGATFICSVRFSIYHSLMRKSSKMARRLGSLTHVSKKAFRASRRILFYTVKKLFNEQHQIDFSDKRPKAPPVK